VNIYKTKKVLFLISLFFTIALKRWIFFKAFYYFALLLKNRKIKNYYSLPLKSTVWNSWCENIDSNLPPYAHPLMPYLFFNFCQKPSYFANQEIAPLLYYYAVIIVFSSSCVKSRRWKKPTTILLWKKQTKTNPDVFTKDLVLILSSKWPLLTIFGYF